MKKMEKRTPLPVVSCEGCGACCMHMGTPPGYSWFFPSDGRELGEWAAESDDWPVFRAMPEGLRRELAEYYAAARRLPIEDREELYYSPCIWLDLETRRCRHYEHRPSICREFEVGGRWCRGHRKDHGIGT